VLLVIFVLPESKKNKFGKIGLILHNIFNFKFLIIEKILQVLYILSTCICVFVGLFSLLGFEGYLGHYMTWSGGTGLLLLLVGPITVRLFYELMMMGLLLVKNVIQINNKIKGEDSSPFATSAQQFLSTDGNTNSNSNSNDNSNSNSNNYNYYNYNGQ